MMNHRVSELPVTATSHDGRQFRFSVGSDVPMTPGRFVRILDGHGQPQLGQVDEVIAADNGTVGGTGRILGTVDTDRRRFEPSVSRAFADALIEDAGVDAIELLSAGAGASLLIGEHLHGRHIPARLLAQKFNRHTFWCGQSGSGKTYALGVVIEQLLVHTGLPLVIFDPNADFVRMREAVAVAQTGAGPSPTAALESRDIRVLRPSADGAGSLLVRFTDLPLSAKGAILRLHPLDDRQEYNELLHLDATVGALEPGRIVPTLLKRGTASAVALATRIENLRILDWQVWSGQRTTVAEIIDERPDATVLDLGGFAFADESLVVVLAVLDDLWAKREARRPVLLVIDEAHNFTSPDGGGPLMAAVRERLIQIAAEGRKFGLWLLLSTQRPSRVHSSIISQCDNLALMKMTSPADIAELASLFGFVPPALLTRAPLFRQGEALFAGGFVPAPTMVRMGARLTREGGTDVRVPGRSAHEVTAPRPS